MKKDVAELMREELKEHTKANQGINEERMYKRAHELHAFLSDWTSPRDLVCMAMVSKRIPILQAISNAGTIKQMQDLLDDLVSGVMHLYALAEARFEADLERRVTKEAEDGARTRGQTKV